MKGVKCNMQQDSQEFSYQDAQMTFNLQMVFQSCIVCLCCFDLHCLMYLGGDSDLKAQEPQDLRPLLMSHGLHECKECDQVFPDSQR